MDNPAGSAIPLMLARLLHTLGPNGNRLIAWPALTILSLAIGWVFRLAAFPSALLLGPMLAATLFALAGSPLRMPRTAIPYAQSVIGCIVAQAVTARIVASILENWPPILLVVVLTGIVSCSIGWVLARSSPLTERTAAWGSMPGAASAMVAMAADYGGDIRIVALMQYFRVVVVVVTASLASRLLLGSQAQGILSAAAPAALPAGDLLSIIETLVLAALCTLAGRRLKLPGGPLLLTTGIGSLAHSLGVIDISLPTWLPGVVYIGLGWYVGLQFNRTVLASAVQSLPQVFTATLALILSCAVLGYVLALSLKLDLLTGYLATSPGGIDSITIIAIGSKANIPFVLAVQALRFIGIILIAPHLVRLISRPTELEKVEP